MISFLDIKPYNCFIRSANNPNHRTPVMFGEYIRVPYFAPNGAMSNLGIYEWLMSKETKNRLNSNYRKLIVVVLENRYFLRR